MKQISITMPDNLFEITKEYANNYGYKNVQEFILETMRARLQENIARWQAIEKEMDAGNKKSFKSQTDAIEYLNRL